MSYCSSTERTIPLTITSQYAKSWKTWEGVREIIQNWHDGIYSICEPGSELQKLRFAARLEEPVEFRRSKDAGTNQKAIRFEVYELTHCTHRFRRSSEEKSLGTLYYDTENERLSLVNRDMALHKKVLLLGFSTKPLKRSGLLSDYTTDRNPTGSLIGQFGEGLKIGALALLREGRLVTLETSKEMWRFELVHQEEFEEKVLTVRIADRPCKTQTAKRELQDRIFPPCPVEDLQADDTCTTISLESKEWEIFMDRFLFLSPPEEGTCIKTPLGSILLADKYKEQLYVQGIWVAQQHDLAVGVDFIELEIDRDRNAVLKPNDIDYWVSIMWVKAVEMKPKLALKRYYDLLKQEKSTRDVKYAVKHISDSLKVAKMIDEQFKKENGPTAFAISYQSSESNVDYIRNDLQKNPVKVNQMLVDILENGKFQRRLDEEMQDHQGKVQKEISPYVISEEDMRVLNSVVEMVQACDPSFNISLIDVIKSEEGGLLPCRNYEDHIDLPSWYLDLNVVHQVGRLCPVVEPPIQCKCREIRLCHAFLQLRQKFVRRPDKPENLEGLKTQPPSNMDHPLMFMLNKVSAQSCLGARKNCKSEGQEAANHELCTERIQKLTNAKEKCEKKIEEIQTQYPEEVQKVKDRLEIATNELKKKEKRTVDSKLDDEKMRENYEGQVKKAEENASKLINSAISDQEKLNTELKETEDERDKSLEKIKDLETKLKEMEEAHGKVKSKLMNEIYEHIKQLKESTGSLQAFYDQESTTEDEGDVEVKIRKICKGIKENIQNTGFISLCQICKTNKREYLFQPCNHYVSCEQCSTEIYEGDKLCPVCGKKIDERPLKVFG